MLLGICKFVFAACRSLTRPAAPTILPLAFLAGAVNSAVGQTSAVWTQHNSNSRTGSITAEKSLKPSTVSKQRFGRLFSYTLDDQTYSQPLYVSGLTMAVDHQQHNVIFVATVNNTVYAWDGDSGVANSGKPLWSQSLTPAGARPPNANDMSAIGACGGRYHDFAGNFGIVGTPVIDTASSTLYVVARTVERGSAYVQRLHALDLISGKEKFGGPRVISARYNNLAFNSQIQNQRSALALVHGLIVIAWASHCDFGGQNGLPNYHGWLMTYTASDLKQTAVWVDTPAGYAGGIWQAGQGVTTDDRDNMYLLTGNGSFDDEQANFSMSAVKLSNSGGKLRIASFFTPSNWENLNNMDMDLGSAGLVAIPNASQVVGGGKDGVLYVLDTGNLGGFTSSDNVTQKFQATFPALGHTGHIHGSPVFLTSDSGEYLYVWGENDFLRVFQYTRGGAIPFNSTAVAASAMRAPQVGTGMPGGFLSLSSDGPSNGIVWALTSYACDANQHVEPGILYAFNATAFTGTTATRVLTELWDSKQNPDRDDVGYFAKYSYPTVANGRVYVVGWGPVPAASRTSCSGGTVPSNQGQISVYGLLP
jgi:hypothetical protein